MLSPRLPTTEITASICAALSACQQLTGHVHFLHHVVFINRADMKRIDPARLAQDAPAPRIQALGQLGAEGHQPAVGVTLRVQHPVKAIADADHLPAQFARCQGRTHHHGIHAWHKAGACHDGNPSWGAGTACFSIHHVPAFRYNLSSSS